MSQLSLAAALASGLAVAVAVVALGWDHGAVPALALLDRPRRPARPPAKPRVRRLPKLPGLPALPLRLVETKLRQAGWDETPERFVLVSAGIAATLAAVGAVAGSLADASTAGGLALVGLAAGGGLSGQLLRSAARRRRERLLAELAPTLDLLGIELSAGSSPLAGLAAVTRHGDGELARELRVILATTAVAADRSADARIHELGEQLDLPPLVALATILATSRDYGAGVSHGIRALALDLRRARRRELIATSRRALSRVLVPAAVGVLLPFLAVLLYPAVTALSASFR